MTAEEIIANSDHLKHFNPFHNPKNGQFAKKSEGGIKPSISPRDKQILKRAAIGAAVIGGISAYATARDSIDLHNMYVSASGIASKLNVKRVAARSAQAAGKAAVATALTVIGGHKVKDLIRKNKDKPVEG